MFFGSNIEKTGSKRRNIHEVLYEEEAAYDAVSDTLPAFLQDDSCTASYTEVALRRELPSSLMLTDDFAKRISQESAHQIYNWYASAMKRRNREPLPEDNFDHHFFNGGSLDMPVLFGTEQRGYLLGFWRHRVFVPTHFAPRTLRGGYELLKDLGKSKDTPAVLVITEDLKTTIVKMRDWQELNINFLRPFRSESMKKCIVYNSHQEVKERMAELANEFLNEQK